MTDKCTEVWAKQLSKDARKAVTLISCLERIEKKLRRETGLLTFEKGYILNGVRIISHGKYKERK